MLRFLSLILLVATSGARAESLSVAVDIAPVHSLVAQVLGDAGGAELIVPPTASPHSYAMRPSQARTLADATFVVWVGPALTPWLEKPLTTLAPDTPDVRLLDLRDTVTLPYRDAPKADGDAQGHASGHGHDHDHDGDVDPHVWLDPENAGIWVSVIAAELGRLDPENAEIYAENAERAKSGLSGLEAEIAETLSPVRTRPFVTFHDAYHYFEARFGLNFAGAVSLSDARDPSPAQLARLRDILNKGQVRCAFREPQFDDRLLRAAAGDLDMEIGVLDPMGSALQPGPDLYAELLRDMAQSLAACR